MNRRDLLKAGAWAIASAGTRLSAGVAEPLSELTYGQVTLESGPAKSQFDQNLQFVLNMSEDAMLKPFRAMEGLPAPGPEMGGWYALDGFCPGAHFGQWMSALARYYSATGDVAARAKLNRLVTGFAATISPEGKFYAHNRFPSYTYDKLVCGLSDAFWLAKDPVAREALRQATAAALPHMPGKAVPRRETEVLHGEDFSDHCWDESYTVPENQFIAAARTGDASYTRVATQYLYDEGFFNELARGENVLPGKHAYSHVNALCSAAQAYLSLGDPKYLRASVNGFRMVQQQSFATGGWGPDEHFFEPASGKLFESLAAQTHSFETPCGAYAHCKLTRYLLRITRDSKYGDSMERVLYNTVFGALPLEPDGRAFYYSDYTSNAHKFRHDDKWPCCSGSFTQVTPDYLIDAYFQDPRGLYVNLYLPSRVKTGEFGLKVTTNYPDDSEITLEITKAPRVEKSVFLRIPEWAEGARLISGHVSGNASGKADPGQFAEIRKIWKAGDRIELDLPLKRRLEAVDKQHPNTVALLAGPLVKMPLIGGSAEPVTRAALLAGKVPSKPFMSIGAERYRVYSQVS